MWINKSVHRVCTDLVAVIWRDVIWPIRSNSRPKCAHPGDRSMPFSRVIALQFNDESGKVACDPSERISAASYRNDFVGRSCRNIHAALLTIITATVPGVAQE